MALESIINDEPFLNGPSFRKGWEQHEKHICRVVTNDEGTTGGTGFLVGPDLILTCFHVVRQFIPGESDGAASDPQEIRCEFGQIVSGNGETLKAESVGVAPDWLVQFQPPSRSDGMEGNHHDPEEHELDYALVRLDTAVGERRAWIALPDIKRDFNKTLPSRRLLTILQHPGLKELAAAVDIDVVQLNSNQTRLQYRVNTEPGSSGSPCFDGNWNLVALHHAGSYDKQQQQKFNQGIPISLIVDDLKRVPPGGAPPPGPPPEFGPQRSVFDPTLIIICTQGDMDRALSLIEHAGIPREFIAQVGNRPPATVADNAIGLYLNSAGAEHDPLMLQTTKALREINIQILPVVQDRNNKQEIETLPPTLQQYNAAQWRAAEQLPEELAIRIRQLLGLSVSPKDRSVFISYSRADFREHVLTLKELLKTKGYDAFVDLEDLPIGDPVQEVIDQKLSEHGQKALLYVETPNAYQSKWIHDELLWAWTRGLAMVVCQPEPVQNRMSLVGPLSPLSLPIEELETKIDDVVRKLDDEIARTNTSMVQLARTIEGIVKHDSEYRDSVTVQSLPNDLCSMELTFEQQVLGKVRSRTILVRNLPRAPQPRDIRQLREDLSHNNTAEGAVLLYDTLGAGLDEDLQETFRALVGDELLWWIPREEIGNALPEILEGLR